jgi:L-lactate dehydrogenase (cytochrome)
LAQASIWAERNFKGAVGIDDIEWLRARWKGKLIVKGILDPEDAKLAASHGADAIVVSNHGGRQLDSARSTARAFAGIQEAVGDRIELLFDSGIRSGLDILKALGLGARGCLIGRAYLYGLAAQGEAGVTTALRVLSQELDAGMALTGVEDVTAIPDGLLIRD